MHPHAIVLTRDLARIGGGLRDRGDADRVASFAGLRAQDDCIADAQVRIGGEPRVDRDGAECVSRVRR
jgi:hypothetical protein